MTPHGDHQPTTCARCHGRRFNRMICLNCGWRPPCPKCGKPINGRADKIFCNARCKKGWWDEQRGPVTGVEGALRVLEQLADGDYRAAWRDLVERRERAAAARAGRPPAPGGRERIRWGSYQPKM